jgi:hypothetical protein
LIDITPAVFGLVLQLLFDIILVVIFITRMAANTKANTELIERMETAVTTLGDKLTDLSIELASLRSEFHTYKEMSSRR